MDERELRGLIADVKVGKLTRRAFVGRMVALGLTAPLAGQMLASAGLAQTVPPSRYKPTKRGGGGALKTLFWQGPTLLNPHFAVGTKDQEGSRASSTSRWRAGTQEGNLIPILATEVPSVENGMLARDGSSVTWKLKQGVQWHDGKPFTADDVVFNWEYAADPATASVTSGSYKDIKVEKIDQYTVKVLFEKPTPFWADAVRRHARHADPEAPLRRVPPATSRATRRPTSPRSGPAPYQFAISSRVTSSGEAVPELPRGRTGPIFDTFELKGGGDAVSAARAVIQTGEFDYAWNLQVEDEILLRLEDGGKGQGHIVPGGNVEHIDAETAPIPGRRWMASASNSVPPTRSCPILPFARRWPAGRSDSVQKYIYGRTGGA